MNYFSKSSTTMCCIGSGGSLCRVIRMSCAFGARNDPHPFRLDGVVATAAVAAVCGGGCDNGAVPMAICTGSDRTVPHNSHAKKLACWFMYVHAAHDHIVDSHLLQCWTHIFLRSFPSKKNHFMKTLFRTNGRLSYASLDLLQFRRSISNNEQAALLTL